MNIALEGKCKAFSAEVLWLHVVISHRVSTENLLTSALLALTTALTLDLYTGMTNRSGQTKIKTSETIIGRDSNVCNDFAIALLEQKG